MEYHVPDLKLEVNLCTAGYEISVKLNGTNVYGRTRDVDSLYTEEMAIDTQTRLLKTLIECSEKLEIIMGNNPIPQSIDIFKTPVYKSVIQNSDLIKEIKESL